MSELSQRFYHERQRRQLCLLHTLNNLFQREEFRKEELDQICEVFDSSSWFNAHRSMLGLGNYDRTSSTSPPTATFPFLRNGRHWFAVKRFGANFFNLDSKLPEPAPINDFTLFANEILARNDEMILVCRPEDRDKVLLNTSGDNN
ncbi:Ubiquitinyl hydrolase 1 [Aphelenchoides fujianensis]|nr:Ubiquitinyl hydrolase 1 [Aphelenchoides fujianensis]